VRLIAAAILAATVAAPPLARQSPGDSGAKIFVFEQPFWLSVHQFLYVLGRAATQAPDRVRRAVSDAPRDQQAGLATLAPGEQEIWRAAVAEYASGLSKKDMVFDRDLATLTSKLVHPSDADIPEVLRRVEPIYRKAWWPAHTRANATRIKALEQSVSDNGAAVLAYITRVYKEPWPAGGYPVNVAAYANWAGAYSTDNQLLVVSSLDKEQSGFAGLEILFHESMHQWDEAMGARLNAAAGRTERRVPDALSHAMIFYTAGAAVHSIAPGYTPYADSNGVWQRGMSALKPVLQTDWQPYLDGKVTLEAALDAMLRHLQ
jgi:hypothetical protein